MRKEQQYFVHGFTSLADAPFSPQDYSRLKFGSNDVAKRFGYELAEGFFKAHHVSLLSQQCVVIPSPYNYIRNAATVMAQHFVDRINHLICLNGGNHVEWSTINRKVSYINDYGFLDKEKRKKLIDQDTFFLNKGYLEGKTLIMIDDVNITGTHEEKLVDILDKNGVENNVFYIYYAKYLNGAVGANIEAEINFAGIKDIYDFIELTKEPYHKVIVRPIKFTMGQPEDVFKKVIHLFPEGYIDKLYFGCLGEGYHKIESYRANFKYLSELLGHEDVSEPIQNKPVEMA